MKRDRIDAKEKIYDRYLKELKSIYSQKRPKSRELFSRMKNFLPGGDTRAVTFFNPFPTSIRSAKGSILIDIDGNVLIDFINNFSSLIHGHADPEIMRTALDQLQRGTVFGAPCEPLAELAEIICKRVPSVERIRFCNSGTEATLGAIRGARAFTKRQWIAKAEGGYHGSHESVEISVVPKLSQAGPIDHPRSLREDESISKEIVNQVVVFPFNNTEATVDIIKKNRTRLAAVIIEPVMHAAGIIPAHREYLKSIREVTAKYDILLIFDEVITFRLSDGGAQKIFRIKPDLTCFGKFIGGGFPVGAFGGRRDIMELFSPASIHPITHTGTFNGNAITMAAGVAAMRKLTPSAIERINSFGDRLRKEVAELFAEFNSSVRVTGLGSLFQIHFSNKDVFDYRTAARANTELRPLLHLGLINEGIFIAKRGCGNISTSITEKELNSFLGAVRKCLDFLKPCIEEIAPDLLLQT